MLTKYLTHLTVTFNPLLPTLSHKTPRLLLSFLPSNATSQGLKISSTILPSSSKSPSRVVVGFKDGREVVFEDLSVGRGKVEGKGKEEVAVGTGVLDLSKMGVNDVVEEVDRHCRVLKRQEELNN